jgi:flagellar protein FliO/FliZ
VCHGRCFAEASADAAADSLATPSAALAAAAAPLDVPVPDTFGLIVKMVLSLAVVLIVIWLAVQAARRMPGRTGGMRRSNVHVLDRTYLAPKKAICIVRIGSRYLALGVTDAQISALAELDPEDAQPPAGSGTESTVQVPFANLFRDVRSRLGRGAREEAS